MGASTSKRSTILPYRLSHFTCRLYRLWHNAHIQLSAVTICKSECYDRSPSDTHTKNTCIHFTLSKNSHTQCKTHIPRSHLLHAYIYKYLLHIYVCMYLQTANVEKHSDINVPDGLPGMVSFGPVQITFLIKTPLSVYSSLQVPSSVVGFTYTKGSWWMVTICNRRVGFCSAFLCGINHFQVISDSWP